jgi:hypothetical protein
MENRPPSLFAAPQAGALETITMKWNRELIFFTSPRRGDVGTKVPGEGAE